MTAQFENLIYDLSATGTATITLNRPEVLNSLNQQLMVELLTAITRADGDPEVRAILITGAGKGFCAGADLGKVELDKTPAAQAAREEVTRSQMNDYLNPIVAALVASDKPVVTAVNGVAAGGGMGIALAADICIAADSASFVQVFIPQLGIIPDMGCTWMLPRLIGRARAQGLALLGEKLSAPEAEAWGLIWKTCPPAELLENATALADKLAQSSAFGIASFKRAMRHSEDNSFDQQLAVEAELQAKCCGGNDFAEGCDAFIHKRKPVFNGQ